jgi:hypothetical protein
MRAHSPCGASDSARTGVAAHRRPHSKHLTRRRLSCEVSALDQSSVFFLTPDVDPHMLSDGSRFLSSSDPLN